MHPMQHEMPLEEKAKGATLKEILKIVQGIIAKEGLETPEQEKLESPDMESLEEKLGVEKDPEDVNPGMPLEDGEEKDPLAKKKVMMVFGSVKAKPMNKMMKKPKYG